VKVTSFDGGCGATVSGIQLSNLSEHDLQGIRKAFADYGLLFFRDQDLSPAKHLEFANRFGDIVLNKIFKPVPNNPKIVEVRKEAHQKTNIGGGWHTDHSYDDIPALGSILVARELPKSGGDTHFSNMYAAYDALSDGLKKTLSGLRASHSNSHLYGEGGYYSGTDMADQLSGHDHVSSAVHPVIIEHPESGKKALYVNPGHTIQFEGWSFDESRALLEHLYKHASQPQFVSEFNWLPGSVTLWDNRCTWHFAQNDYDGEARLMHRITLAGSQLKAGQ
jgi:taurine dioxygenase